MSGYGPPKSMENIGIRARNPLIYSGLSGYGIAGKRILNQRIAGSSPARPTRKIKGLGATDLTLFSAGGLPVYFVGMSFGRNWAKLGRKWRNW